MRPPEDRRAGALDLNAKGGCVVKYLIGEGPPLRLGGVLHQPGQIVELFGRQQRAFFGDRLIDIDDPLLIRALELNAHPYYVTTDAVWGRQTYRAGDIYWAPNRTVGRMISTDRCRVCGVLWPQADDAVLTHAEACDGDRVAAWARPATGQEVIDYVRRVEGLTTPASIETYLRRKQSAQAASRAPRGLGRRLEAERGARAVATAAAGEEPEE